MEGMSARRSLVAIAFVGAGCNALTGIGDLRVAADADAGIADAAPTEGSAPVVDGSGDVQASDGAVETSIQDATQEDTSTPPPPTTPASCADVLARNKRANSGKYLIDPDGNGGAVGYEVFCDMTTAGGGWTEIFRWTTDLASLTNGYTNGTPALMKAVSTVMIANRTAVGAIADQYATFAIPADWRTQPPFQALATDVNVSVSVGGADPVEAMLRYGSDDFDTTCAQDWLPNNGETYGRICIASTVAPFFAGFAASDADECNTSDEAYNDMACSSAVAFSIAVR